ncbi:unnamed protein product [[Candida] boidinii]|uniref:Unnamed protein product n=1 Tax=Candida boidinii TaxID=5477 RepID=A0A9W6WG58_CANBO|nr:unnamed protein product [[Candida] boidinii]GMF99240.1 unnamed protein product [[Candida] boidinii]
MKTINDLKLTYYELPKNSFPEPWSTETSNLTKLILNYTGLQYEMIHIAYPDIKSTLQKLNVQPFKLTIPSYTLPALTFTDITEKNEYTIMGSFRIIKELENIINEKLLDSDVQDNTVSLNNFIEKIYFDKSYKLFSNYLLIYFEKIILKLIRISLIPYTNLLLDHIAKPEMYSSDADFAITTITDSVPASPEEMELNLIELYNELNTFKSLPDIILDNGGNEEELKFLDLNSNFKKNGYCLFKDKLCLGDFIYGSFLNWVESLFKNSPNLHTDNLFDDWTLNWYKNSIKIYSLDN